MVFKKKSRPRRRYFSRLRRRVKGKAVPILPTLGFASGFIIPVSGFGNKSAVQLVQEGSYSEALRAVAVNFTGYDYGYPQGGWNFGNAKALHAVIAGVVGHKVMNMIGVNAYLRKLPLIGKYISL